MLLKRSLTTAANQVYKTEIMYFVHVFSSFINMVLDSVPVLIVAQFRGAPGKLVGIGARPCVASKS